MQNKIHFIMYCFLGSFQQPVSNSKKKLTNNIHLIHISTIEL